MHPLLLFCPIGRSLKGPLSLLNRSAAGCGTVPDGSVPVVTESCCPMATDGCLFPCTLRDSLGFPGPAGLGVVGRDGEEGTMAGRLHASRTIVELAPAVAVSDQSIASRGSLAVPGPAGIGRGKSIRNWLSPFSSRGPFSSSPGPAGSVLWVVVVVVVVVVWVVVGRSIGRHRSVPGVGALGVEVLEGRGGGEGGL